jgi:hypothetical protein
VRARELAERFEARGYRRSRLDGVAGQTRGFYARQVHGTEVVRVVCVGTNPEPLERLCSLWGLVVVPLTEDTFEVLEAAP